MSVRVLDGLFPAALTRAAAAAWPAADWPGWVRYDSPLEKKLACPDWKAMPAPCRELLALMLCLPVTQWVASRLAPDATLHGAGMHAMAAGGHLDLHLDADRHPVLGLERRANAILFVGEWRKEWDGAFELWDERRERRLEQVHPADGRMLLFETNDVSVHGVPGPLACPGGVLRKSMAVYWWGRPRGASKRPRAQFVGRPGEGPDPEKEALRRERMRVP